MKRKKCKLPGCNVLFESIHNTSFCSDDCRIQYNLLQGRLYWKENKAKLTYHRRNKRKIEYEREQQTLQAAKHEVKPPTLCEWPGCSHFKSDPKNRFIKWCDYHRAEATRIEAEHNLHQTQDNSCSPL